MAKKEILVSIIVPVYNVEKYLDECLASILKQSFNEFEIILIDDGSTDKTVNICDDYEKKYENIRVFHQNNKGVAACRNFGISLAKGSFISFVDGDDFIDQNYIKILYNTIKNIEDCDMSICYLQKRYFEGDVLKNVSNPTFMISKTMDEDSFWDTDFGMKGVINLMTNKMFRKTLFDGLSFEGIVYEDSRMIHNLVKKAKRMIVVPEVLYFLRRYGNSLTYRTDTLTSMESNYIANYDRFCDFYDRKKYKLALKFLKTCLFVLNGLVEKTGFKIQKFKFAQLRKLKIRSGGVFKMQINYHVPTIVLFEA
ncbi:MAG: glycosyltransferase family 2 protein [Clostridia bacterium]|nr:glycosyltransferase family 2 protein [Clostridia bacterium]